ncbi:hypothetical protein FQN49_008395, partial [Arthroderma sp. PD_2]
MQPKNLHPWMRYAWLMALMKTGGQGWLLALSLWQPLIQPKYDSNAQTDPGLMGSPKSVDPTLTAAFNNFTLSAGLQGGIPPASASDVLQSAEEANRKFQSSSSNTMSIINRPVFVRGRQPHSVEPCNLSSIPG